MNWYLWVLLGALALSFVVQLFYYLYYYTGILTLKWKTQKTGGNFSSQTPGVSVIICARNESENLRDFLSVVLAQDYPNYEVIVVNDGSTDETETLLRALARENPHLYHTCIPQNAQVMSPKKLALTVAIKAAKKEILLFTDADCYPVSESWIRKMIRNFTPKTDFVLGYGAYERHKGLLSHLISYDTFFIAMQYMGFSYRGCPYMAVGRNMAYRRKVFFENRGFASILHLQSGDDDLFVNKRANKNNTRIEINAESKTISRSNTEFKDWFIQKERHLSTASYYRPGSKCIIGTEVGSRGIFYLSILGLILLAPLPLLLIALGFFILRYITQAIVINLSARNFNERKFYFSILVFDIALPLISLYTLCSNQIRRKTKYKWK
ncbi:MAG: glycosyltransferase [Prevotellaceae bacterium]|nr:glycosyltransferase [Prevotellaceae bacterium]